MGVSLLWKKKVVGKIPPIHEVTDNCAKKAKDFKVGPNLNLETS